MAVGRCNEPTCHAIRVQSFQEGVQRPALRRSDLALTSSRLVNGQVAVEVARQQPDGTWLWAIDQPAIARETP